MLKDISGFNKETIVNEVKEIGGKDSKSFLFWVDFLFSPIMKDITDEVDERINLDSGGSRYPVLFLLSIHFFAQVFNVGSVKNILEMCKHHDFVKIFTRGVCPCGTTLTNFLKDFNNDKMFKILFLSTLVKANDISILKFVRIFIDGTNALLNASRFNEITREQFTALKYFYNNDLLKRTRNQSDMSYITFLRSIEENYTDKVILDYFDIAIKNPFLFTKKVAKKLSKFEKAFKNTDKDKISFNFPQAVMMKTKKGNFDYCFNLQLMISEKNLILGGLFVNKPNDQDCLYEVIQDLRENFIILLELVEKYGYRRNYKEIKNLLSKAILIMDSGYFTEKNLKILEEEGFNAYITSIKQAKDHNRKIKINEDNNNETKSTDKFTKKDFTRVNDGFKCPEGKILHLTEVKESKKENCITNEYIHECDDCSQCKQAELCLKKDETKKTIIDKTSPRKYKMASKSASKTGRKMTKGRFPINEHVNGNLKPRGFKYYLGNNYRIVTNQMLIDLTIRNLITLDNYREQGY
ncbi:MAG: transposase [Methanobrevibacter sp.]|jgi:hypothetical protein|nr:transposase [Candidatus Methanoflexus mossambicus]